MTRYLTLAEVEKLHALVVQQSGGATGLRDRGGLESAMAQPQQTFGGDDFYPTLPAKAAALAHSLVMGHPFVDGNKRVGHAAMEASVGNRGERRRAGRAVPAAGSG